MIELNELIAGLNSGVFKGLLLASVISACAMCVTIFVVARQEMNRVPTEAEARVMGKKRTYEG